MEKEKKKTPQSKLKYDKKYNQEKRKVITLNLDKATAKEWNECAIKEGKSLSAYIKDCVIFYESQKTIKSEQLEETPISDKQQTTIEKPTSKGLTFNRHD